MVGQGRCRWRGAGLLHVLIRWLKALCHRRTWHRRDGSTVVALAVPCPITLELMADPVTVATGQTYDRASIRRCVKNGCRTCPVTGEKLCSTNVVVCGIVEQVLLSNGISLHEPSSRHWHTVEKTATPFGAAAAGGVRVAVAFLVSKLCWGTLEEQKKATYEAWKLSKHNVFHRACLVDASAMPLGLIVDTKNVAAKVEAQQNAATILFYLSSNTDYCNEISRIPEAIPTLVHLIREGTYRGRKNALVSLYGVLQCGASSHGKVVSAGTVAELAALLCSNRDSLVNDAVVLLVRLAKHPVGAAAVLSRSELVMCLIDFLSVLALRSAKDHCTALLASLCQHGGDIGHT
ncbi:hypothetical protein E2562_021935 [Oryza meyeriana var. granulata]|uniref:RING-type E3 ubiquitin transferase n=1 Tax=Oryza meyeriana var. granulata TaxID=110450 RepID=A0A6G1DNK0_9ORYZ|nr:hypothetical protein E2562_021935 [Oryza meyeriana var. granulata]